VKRFPILRIVMAAWLHMWVWLILMTDQEIDFWVMAWAEATPGIERSRVRQTVKEYAFGRMYGSRRCAFP
jgi:hypothetical protein